MHWNTELEFYLVKKRKNLMKNFTKKMLVLPLFASAALLNVSAQDVTATVTSFKTCMLDGEEVPLAGTLRVSDNGKYAVGYDDENGGFTYAAYLVDVETMKMTYLNDYTGSKNDGLKVFDVSDDGTIVGTFLNHYTSSTGRDSLVWTIGYKPLNGDWVDLPLPEKANKKWLSYFSDSPDGRLISPDGKVICAVVQMAWNDEDGKYHSVWAPVIYHIDGEGKVTMKEIDYNMLLGHGQGLYVYDMTDDGRYVVGRGEASNGGGLPMMYDTQENKYIQLNKVKIEDSEDGDYFTEGQAMFIDNEKNVYLTYKDAYGKIHSEIYNITTGETKDLPSGINVSCGIPGFVLGSSSYYGPATVIEGPSVSLSPMSAVLSMSDDGKVLAGCGYTSSEYGEWNYPAITVLSGTPSGVKGVQADGVSVGADKAEVFNVQGQNVGSSLSGLSHGMYVVKGVKDGKAYTRKVVK